MGMNLSAKVNPGSFKTNNKDPKRMLADFNIYTTAFSNFLMVTDNSDATDAKRKAMLQTVGGPDMVILFEYIGKVPHDAT